MAKQRYSSIDFSRVPSALVADEVERLVHQSILDGAAEDQIFSQERRHLVRVVDLPTRTLSVTIGGLEPGQSTRKHRHNYETVIYVVQGRGESSIGDRIVQWKAGDAFYVPTWAWHQHANASQKESVIYVACENSALLQNLGIAVREEA